MENNVATNGTSGAVILILDTGKYGATKTDRRAKATVENDKATEDKKDAKPERYKVVKDLLGGVKEFDAVASFDGKLKERLGKMELALSEKEAETVRYLDGRTRSNRGILKAGCFRFAVTQVPRLYEILTEAKSDWERLVEAFLAVYDEKVKEQEKELGDMFNPGDYPTKEQVRSQYRIRWDWRNMVGPVAISTGDPITDAIFEEERRKAVLAVDEERDEAIGLVRLQAKTIVDRVANALAPAGAGEKVKQFHYTALRNLQEFVELFPERNGYGRDLGMAEEVANLKELISPNADPKAMAKELRNDTEYREGMAEAIEKVKVAVDDLQTIELTRKFNFDPKAL